MGHSIIGFKNDIPIASLQFWATNYVKSSYLYKVLDAEEYNNGVSGNGESKIYTHQDILKAKAALNYYEKESFEEVRNIEKEQQAEIFISHMPGLSATAQECFSMKEISQGILSVREFLETILKEPSTIEIKINFG